MATALVLADAAELVQEQPVNHLQVAIFEHEHGDPHKALYYYQQFLDSHPERPVGIWSSEEYAYALMRMAGVHWKLNSGDAIVIDTYLRSYEALPTRAEPLYELCVYLRHKGRYRVALPFAKLAASIPMPNTNFHLRRDIYDFRAKDEYAVALTWLFKDKECLEIYNTLLREGKVPESERDRVFGMIADCYRKISR